jgi:hypothetical protein
VRIQRTRAERRGAVSPAPAFFAVSAGPLPAICLGAALLLAGCRTAEETTRPEDAIPEGAEFGYTVAECSCAEYTVDDPHERVTYGFRASYSMNDGIVTEIRVTLRNGSADTLFLGTGSVKVSSTNIRYQYNDLFVPLPDLAVAPGRSEELTFVGSEVTDRPSWRRIAGERLTPDPRRERGRTRTAPARSDLHPR